MSAVRFKRLVYLTHRWLGVGGCLLMLLWTVSGIVMLYVGYPRLLPDERLSRLPPLAAGQCCVPVEAALARTAAADPVLAVTLTSVAGRPYYRLTQGAGGLLMVDAVTGRLAAEVDDAVALASARAFLPGAGTQVRGRVQDDRWTHSRALDAHRPLFAVQADDAAATLLYVSSVTGEVVLDAPLSQRAWNFMGAWLHWLYMFREGSRDPVWSWAVIVLSALGTISAITGAVVGVWRWRFGERYRTGSRTPYRGRMMRWHHLTGLVFGTLLISWVFSGLMSMNPFDVFVAKGARPDISAWRGGEVATTRVSIPTADALRALAGVGFHACEIEWRVLAGQPYLVARDAAGSTRLLKGRQDAVEIFEYWPVPDLEAAAARLMPAPPGRSELIARHDAYYYARRAASMYAGGSRGLPALQLEFTDAGSTRVYIDVRTGDIALSLDRSQRTGRWLFNLLHSWDPQILLDRPILREVLITGSSLGLLVIVSTGTVVGWRRLARANKPWRRRHHAAHRRPSTRMKH